MFPLVLLLSSLYTLSCFAANLEHFQDVTKDHTHSEVYYYSEITAFRQFLDENKEAVKEECAKECLESKYICKSFILAYGPHPVYCQLYDKPVAKLNSVHYPQRSVEMFEALDHYVEPVVKRFSYYDQHHMSVDQWEEDIFVGYGLKKCSGPLRDIIRVSKDAMYFKPSKAIEFKKWLNGMDLEQSQRSPLGLDPDKMMEDIKLWQEHENQTIAPESSAPIVLAFLDIFSRSISPDVVTAYDPIERILFINYNDRHILVAAVGPGDYVLIQSQQSRNPNLKKPVVTQITWTGNELNPTDDLVHIFQQAVTRLNPLSKFEYQTYRKGYTSSRFERCIWLLDNAFAALFSENSDVTITSPSPPALGDLFYGDLVTAVISRIYGNMRPQFVSQLMAMAMGNKFGDVNVLAGH